MKVLNNRVAVIIPVYNEAKVLKQALAPLIKQKFSCICINDGSSDASSEILKSLGIESFNHLINLGQGAAIETGFEYVRRNTEKFDYVVTFDSDGQHTVDSILDLLKEITRTNHEVILGSRFLSKFSNVPKIKKVLLRMSSILARVSMRMKITDRHNGLRIFTTQAVLKIYIKESGYAHADDILRQIKKRKMSYSECPVEIKYTVYSKSKGQPLSNIFTILFNNIVRS